MDKNPTNNEKSNIKYLCQKCHKAFHLGAGVLTVFTDEILSIDLYGEAETYDIVLEEKPHNFVANGLVVHNSTRYCNYGADKFGNECSFIEPPGLNEEAYHSWSYACRTAETEYFSMLESDCTPQIARSVLPTCLKTEIVMTANFREWRHFIQLRASKAAHPQIRPIAKEIWSVLYTLAPEVFDMVID